MSEIIKPASVTEVKNACSYFISLYGLASVDEDGFLQIPGDEPGEVKPFLLGKGDNNHMKVSIFQDPMPDPKKVGGYWVLNPFSTKAQVTHAQNLFYNSYRLILSSRILKLMQYIADAVLTNKGVTVANKNFQKLEITSDIMELVSKKTDTKKTIAEEIDEKMFLEIVSINDDKVRSEFLTRTFITEKLETVFGIPFLNRPDWFKERFDITLRKKTISTLTAILRNIFGVQDGDEFSKKYSGSSELNEAPRFSSLIKGVAKIQFALNKYYSDLDENSTVDMTIMNDRISNLPNYTMRAKTMVSDKIMPVETKTPSMGNMMPSAAPAVSVNNFTPQPLSTAHQMNQMPAMPQMNNGFSMPVLPSLPMLPTMGQPQIMQTQPMVQPQPMPMQPSLPMMPQAQSPTLPMMPTSGFQQSGTVQSFPPPSPVAGMGSSMFEVMPNQPFHYRN